MTILRLHHISLLCANAQRTLDFYTQVLGLRLVKQTVNFDDPGSYHLYFGNALGEPGSAVTFFEWPGVKRGHPGVGGTHHFALSAPDFTALLQWKRRLTDLGLSVTGPLDRHYFRSIYFNDPDGTIIEIATLGPGWAIDEPPDQLGQAFRPPPEAMLVNNRDEARIRAETWPEPVPAITAGMALTRGLHHVTAIGSDIGRTHAFLGELLGLQRVKMTHNFDDPHSAHWYWGADGGRPGTLITYFERDPAREPRARMGGGQAHHYALAVADDDAHQAWRQKLLDAGLKVTPVLDRLYFKSLYTTDPDGHIVELATTGPGFAVDESPAELGTRLQLPPWLEDRRAEIAGRLRPLTVPAWNPPTEEPAQP